MVIETFGLGDVVALSRALRRAGEGAANMEEAAQRVAEGLRELLTDTTGETALALARVFKTHRLGALPADLRALGSSILEREGLAIEPGTACLTLIGTSGIEPAWCDRALSASHQVIPLPTREVIRRAPMILGLLSELGVDLEALVAGTTLNPPGEQRFRVFHVEDARGSTRVPAQEQFVVPYGIRSAVGFGGVLADGEVFAVVLFSRVPVSRDIAQLLRPLSHAVNLALLPFTSGPVFSSDAAKERPLPDPDVAVRLAALEELIEIQELTVHDQMERLVEERTALHRSLTELRRSESRYASLVRASAQIVWRTRADGAVEDSPEWRVYTGQSVEEVRGWGWLDAIHPDDRAHAAAAWQLAVDQSTAYEVEYRIRAADGSYHPHLVRGVPLVEDGRICEWVGTCTDVSQLRAQEEAREIASERLAMLSKAGHVLAQDLDLDVTLEALMRLVVPTLADWCCVHLCESTGEIRFTCAQHSDPGLQSALEELLHNIPVATTHPFGAGHVIATGRSEILPAVTDEMLAAISGDDEELFARLRSLKVASGVVVPLEARGRVVGALSLASAGAELTQDEQSLAEDIARRAALAIDNARSFRAAREVAVSLQRGLLPELPAIPGLALAARYVAGAAAAQVGGDWYDAFQLRDGSTAVVIGDVMGHDLGAAASMGQLRSVLRTAAWEGDPPARVLDRLDQLVQGFGMADLATVWYGRLSQPDDHGWIRLRYANAGHLPPMLISPGTEPTLLSDTSVLIGVIPGEPRADVERCVAPGSILVLYTDGLVERADEDIDEGLTRLRRVAAEFPPTGDLRELCSHLLSGVRAVSNRDDVAVLAVRLIPPWEAATDLPPSHTDSRTTDFR